ncbi:hypothetical protein [Prescottella equi]|uniref:hypothetical protein n=1 Tax=Rhodococcus hoagii TaxID=43767 RepID=UPI0009BCFCA0|nr:hypothetical protein [Prescottella equi]
MAGAKPTSEVAARRLITDLRELTGSKLIAYLAGARDTRIVRTWADGASPVPDQSVVDRLQAALVAAQTVAQRDSPAVVQAWFLGRNPALGDRSPAEVLRNADVDRALVAVMEAAREFAAGGTNS